MTNISEDAAKEWASKKRELLRPLLAQCTEEQVALFNRMYGSIDEIAEDKMRWAYIQIKNTLAKVKKEPPQ